MDFDQVLFLFFETGSPYVAQVGLKLRILLLQLPMYWDSRHAPPSPVYWTAQLHKGQALSECLIGASYRMGTFRFSMKPHDNSNATLLQIRYHLKLLLTKAELQQGDVTRSRSYRRKAVVCGFGALCLMTRTQIRLRLPCQLLSIGFTCLELWIEKEFKASFLRGEMLGWGGTGESIALNEKTETNLN
jgi:hypothetical protein